LSIELIMPTARLILCEKTSRWAVALRRALGPQADVLVETRSLADCGRELAAAPASIVTVECTLENLEKVLTAISEWSRRFRAARFVALREPALEPAAPLLQEAGCVSVLPSPRQSRGLARMALRQLARAPQPDLPLEDSFVAALPWPTAATRTA
jgi:hypothetical protein